jgi:hypothetical protein
MARFDIAMLIAIAVAIIAELMFGHMRPLIGQLG